MSKRYRTLGNNPTMSDVMGYVIIFAILAAFVGGFVLEVQQYRAERKCLNTGYATTKSIGFNTWCSKVENGSTVTVQVR